VGQLRFAQPTVRSVRACALGAWSVTSWVTDGAICQLRFAQPTVRIVRACALGAWSVTSWVTDCAICQQHVALPTSPIVIIPISPPTIPTHLPPYAC
jgi:hypothetical protein